MIKIGLTGGIGSGKTIVCKVFESLDIPVYYADTRAKELMLENESLKTQLKNYFGEEIYKDDQINKSYLSQIIFNNEEALSYINSIVHPAVGSDFIQWAQCHSNAEYIIEEAALIFESGSYKNLDILITVTCPEEIRIRRVMERDGVLRDDVLRRIKSQWDEEEKVRLSDYIIKNDGKQSIIEQVNDIHKSILKKTIT